MNLFPSFVVDKRRFYAQKSITQLFLVFSTDSGRHPASDSSLAPGSRCEGKIVSASSRYLRRRLRNSTVQMLLIGLCLGVTLGIAFVPFLDTDYGCNHYSINDPNAKMQQQKLPRIPMPIEGADAGKIGSRISIDPSPASKPTPAIKTLGNSKSILNKSNTNSKNPDGLRDDNNNNKLRRPRYFSTELGLRKKLLAGIILSNKKIDNLIGINQTLSQRVDKLLFFVGGNESTNLIGRLKAQGLSGLVEVPRTSNLYYDQIDYNKVVWTLIKYFAEKFVESYDYFFIALDKYYINGRLLMDLVSKVSVSQDTLWGIPRGDFCSLEHGFIISRRIIQRLASKLDKCFSTPGNSSNEFARCIRNLLSGKYSCESTVQALTYTTTIPTSSSESLYSAVTVGPIDSSNVFYNVHRQTSLSRYAYLQQNIQLIQSKIQSLFPNIPPKFQIPVWPIGTPSASVPKSRFDVISWTYFTPEKMYAKNELSVQSTIQGIDSKDLSHVIQSSLKYIQKQKQLGELPNRSLGELKFYEGYRRHDPIRGMEYILHFQSKSKEINQIVRIEGVRPISKMELVSMPFVTENRRITIIVPVTAQTVLQQVRRFLDRFFDFSVDHKLNTVLVLTLMMPKEDIDPSRQRDVEEIKNMISRYNAKTPSSLTDGVKAGYILIPSRSGNSSNSAAFLASADAVIKRIVGPAALVLTMDVSVNVKDEFLNRVRMSTVLNWQVYSPIPFVEYNPSIYLGRKKEDSKINNEIEVTKNSGYFDSSIFRFFSFFAADYLEARKSSIGNASIETVLNEVKDYSVLERLFIKSSRLHILRAPEPHLQAPFSFPSGCSNFGDCVQTKWGSRAQLAQVILNSRDTLKRKSV